MTVVETLTYGIVLLSIPTRQDSFFSLVLSCWNFSFVTQRAFALFIWSQREQQIFYDCFTVHTYTGTVCSVTPVSLFGFCLTSFWPANKNSSFCVCRMILEVRFVTVDGDKQLEELVIAFFSLSVFSFVIVCFAMAFCKLPFVCILIDQRSSCMFSLNASQMDRCSSKYFQFDLWQTSDFVSCFVSWRFYAGGQVLSDEGISVDLETDGTGSEGMSCE